MNTIKIIVLTIAFFSIHIISAQSENTEPPTPPKPPITTSVTNSKTHSVTYSSDSGQTSSSSSSVSVKSTNSLYKFRASFDSAITPKVRKLLVDRLSELNLTQKNGSKSHWGLEVNGEEAFECKLQKGYLRIYVNKEETSNSFQNKIEALGEDLKETISGR